VRQCAQLHAAGHRIVIVTSGAIAAGREHLGYPELPATIASKQLLAAVGQSRLIQLWEQLFSIYGIHIGQMLLTRAKRRRMLELHGGGIRLLEAKQGACFRFYVPL
jgi:glutamate 5-kinase